MTMNLLMNGSPVMVIFTLFYYLLLLSIVTNKLLENLISETHSFY